METDALLRAQITKGWSGGRKGAEPALCLPTHPQAHLKKKNLFIMENVLSSSWLKYHFLLLFLLWPLFIKLVRKVFDIG